MKILSVTDAFPPETWGGAEISCYELGLALRERGLDVSVLTIYRSPHKVFDDVYFVVHRESKVPFFRDFYRWEVGAMKMARELKKILLTDKFDIIHAHGPVSAYSILWAKRSGARFPKLVFTMRNPWPACPFTLGYCLTDYLKTRLCASSLKGACMYYFGANPLWMKIVGLSPYVMYKTITYQLSKHVLRKFDRVVTISNFLKKALTKRMNIPKERVLVIYNAIDIRKYFVDDLSVNSKLVLFVGRLTPDKGIQYLIKAFYLISKKHPDHKLAIIGYGPYKKVLENMVRRLHLEDRVSLLGYVPPSKLCAYYLRAEIVVHPSIYPEPFGRVLVEAMAAGKPVVATKVGGIPEVIRDGEDGVLVEPLDYEGIARAVNYLIDNPDVGRKMGMKAQLTAKSKYSIERMTEDYISLYRTLLSSSPNEQRLVN